MQPASHLLSISTEEATAVIGAILATLGIVTWIATNVYRLNRRAKETIIRQEHQRILLEKASVELNPNHGGSLKDAVDRIETDLAATRSQLAGIQQDHLEGFAALDGKVRDVSARLDQVVVALITKKGNS